MAEEQQDSSKTQVTGPAGRAASVEVFVPETEPRVWKAVCDRLGVAANHSFEKLGAGSSGTAYLLDAQTVVKFSGDASEAEAMAKIAGTKYETLVHVRDVFRFKVREGLLNVIVQERLDTGDDEWKSWGEMATFYYYVVLGGVHFNTGAISQFREWCQMRFGKSSSTASAEQVLADDGTTKVQKKSAGKPMDRSVLFKENNPMQPIAPKWGRPSEAGAKPPSDEFYRWFKVLCEELANAEVSFFDLNGGNMMKRSGKHVVTDLGQSETVRPKKIDVLSSFYLSRIAAFLENI